MTDKKKKFSEMNEAEKLVLLKECQERLQPRIKIMETQIEESKVIIDKKSDLVDSSIHKLDSPKDSMVLYRELRQAQRDLLAEEKAFALMGEAYVCETYKEHVELSREIIHALAEISGVIADDETIEQDAAKNFQYAQGFYDGISAGYKYLNNKFLDPK